MFRSRDRAFPPRWAAAATFTLFYAWALIAGTTVSAQTLPPPAAPSDISAAQPIYVGSSYPLHSKSLGDTREINVWVPPDYARTQQRYPVIYLLDGALDQDFGHIAGIAQLASLSWTFGPMIVVGVQTKKRIAELTSSPTDARYRTAFPESGGADRFRRFLAQEVIPLVERRYRTGPRKALMGESLAGLFVIDTLLTRPDMFDDYIAVSPSLWWDDRRPMRAAATSISAKSLAGRRLYLAVGNEGGTGQDGVDLLRSALARRGPRSFSFKYSDRSATATHATVYHSAAEEALRWLYPAPPDEGAQTPWYMIDGAVPPPPAAAKK